MQISIPKWFGVIAGTIVLGAIGSGVWETVLRPVLPQLANFFLSIATFGLKQLRDGLYVEIARGSYGNAALQTYEAIVSAVCGLNIVVLGTGFFVLRLEAGRPQPRAVSTLLRSRKAFIGLQVVLAIITGIVFVNLITTSYEVRASAHIEQYERIVSPYLSDKERLVLASRIGQMRTREDYQRIISDLDNVAKRCKLNVPDFSVF